MYHFGSVFSKVHYGQGCIEVYNDGNAIHSGINGQGGGMKKEVPDDTDKYKTYNNKVNDTSIYATEKNFSEETVKEYQDKNVMKNSTKDTPNIYPKADPHEKNNNIFINFPLLVLD